MILLQTAISSETSLAPLFFKMMAACIIVIVLALVAIKYLMPRITGMGKNRNSDIEVLDYQALGPKRMIYIVQIQDKKVALGVTDQSVTKICDLS